jgi:hypothetical protein
MTVDKAQFDTTLKNVEKDLEETSEELSKVSIECDVWRSKFLASRFVSKTVHAVKCLNTVFSKWQISFILSHIFTTIFCTE